MMKVLAITFSPQYKQQRLTENKNNATINYLEKCWSWGYCRESSKFKWVDTLVDIRKFFFFFFSSKTLQF